MVNWQSDSAMHRHGRRLKPGNPMATNTADIRQYLTSAYSDEELTTLCSDYFRDVYDNFTAGMSKTAKIQLLLDHCQRREVMPDLRAALGRDRPDQYRKRFGQTVAEPSPAAASQGRDPRQVFISHAHEDAGFAHRLAADLARAVGAHGSRRRASERGRNGWRQSIGGWRDVACSLSH